jgi:hypothetical protein
MVDIETIRLVGLILSMLLFIFGFFRSIFMPLAYLAFLLLKFPNYYPVLAEYRFESIVAVIGTLRTLLGSGSISRLKMHNNKYFYIFLLTIIISFLFAWDKKYSWEFTMYPFIGNILLYIMIICSIKNTKDLKLFIWLFLLLYTFMSWEPVYYYLTGRQEKEYFGSIVRAQTGLLEGHRALANNMNQIIPIAFFIILTVRSNINKIFSAIPLTIFVTTLILGKARIGVVVFLFFIFLLVYYSKQRIKHGIMAGLAIICLMLFSIGFSSTASRINTGEISDSMLGLFHGFEMVRKGNILGVGPGCYPLARGYYFSHTMGAHNFFGEIIGDLGIPGAIASVYFLWNIFLNLKISVKNLKPEIENQNYLLNLLMGIKISFMVRLFIGLASHSIYIFYWYFVAALTVVIYDLTGNKDNNIKPINLKYMKTV